MRYPFSLSFYCLQKKKNFHTFQEIYKYFNAKRRQWFYEHGLSRTSFFLMRYPFKIAILPRYSWLQHLHKDQMGCDVYPPGFDKNAGEVKDEYDFYLIPDGIRLWFIIFLSVILFCWIIYGSTLFVLSLFYPEDFSRHSFYSEFYAAIFFLSFTMLFYYLTYHVFLKIPLLRQCWGDQLKSYEKWFQRVPQYIKLSKIDYRNGKFKHKDWFSKRKFKPKITHQPLYIKKHMGSAQKSFALLALQDYYDKLKQNRFLFFLREYVLIIPLLAPVWISYNVLFLFLVWNIIIFKESNLEHLLISERFLLISILGWFGLSILYMLWLRFFFQMRKNREIMERGDIIKYIPPNARRFIHNSNLFYHYYQEAHFQIIIAALHTVMFSVYLIIISQIPSFKQVEGASSPPNIHINSSVQNINYDK